MSLKLYNTLTRTKDVFTPIDAARVRIYVCGPTVYDFAHIGNARPLIVFDVLYRLLRHVYGAPHVTYVRNITDVDDKINARAAERGITIRELTEDTNKVFQADVTALGCLPPDVQPRATEHIAEMRDIIERLVKGGFAYVADEHVLFSPAAMDAASGGLPRYGALANRSLDEMIAGARVDVAPYKRDATDFVLWKPSKDSEPGWASPCGIATNGRPGWHIECSAMSWKHLGQTFDIHGGGIDLVFPHHENEIAQTCCAFEQPRMANVWMHNGFLQVEGEKMSKSLGNFITIHELLKQYEGSVLRLNMLRTHYREPIDWKSLELERANRELADWADTIDKSGLGENLEAAQIEALQEARIDSVLVKALSDDLNTPLAIARLSQLAQTAKHSRDAAKTFLANLTFLGLDKNIDKPGYFYESFTASMFESGPRVQLGSPEHKKILSYRALTANGFIQSASIIHRDLSLRGIYISLNDKGVLHVGNETSADFKRRVQEKIDARIAARKAKDFKESDRIRDELDKMGIQIMDRKDANGEITTDWNVKS